MKYTGQESLSIEELITRLEHGITPSCVAELINKVDVLLPQIAVLTQIEREYGCDATELREMLETRDATINLLTYKETA